LVLLASSTSPGPPKPLARGKDKTVVHVVVGVKNCVVRVGSYNAKVATAAMIEVIAAVAGASISVAAMGAMGFSRKNDEARDAVIRLTSAVEHIAAQLEILHGDIRDERKETFGRLNSVEQRVSKLEVRPSTYQG